MGAIHDAAQQGYAAGSTTYERARPRYHPALVDLFVDRYGQGHIVELGAGTGIFTSALIDAGVTLTAVEPVAAMLTTLRDSVPAAHAVEGTAECVPLDRSTADTVVAAQAFHWFDHGPALDEIARLLVDGGHLVTAWNVRDESVPWVAEYTEVVDRHADDTPRHRTMRWRESIDTDQRFTLVDDWHIDHPVPTDSDGVVGRAMSTSFIAALPERERQRVATDLRAIVASLGPIFDYPYRAELQAWQIDTTWLSST